MGAVNKTNNIPKRLLLAGITYSYYYFFTQYICHIGTCRGKSMEPTLYDRDIIVMSKLFPYVVKKWDIVVVKSPSDPDKYWCKRVVHLPGEFVTSGSFIGRIPKGLVWLEGDNSAVSTDSRDYGPVPISLIVGKVILKIWPSLVFSKLKYAVEK